MADPDVAGAELTENRIVLFDGNSIINRAYFALAGRRPLTAPDGTPTGALFGFLNIYLKYMADLEPDHVCVAFDRKEPTFRHKRYDGYKATRKPMPDDLAIQMPLIKKILRGMNVATVELAGYEADDLLGTLASRAADSGMDAVIVSGDRDGLQLVSGHISLILPITRSGQTNSDRFDVAAVHERYGVSPEQLIDVKALMGDSSDNVPGVRGIGEKGALDLIQRFGSLEGVYAHLDELRPAQVKNLTESRDMAFLSRDLVRIDCAVPVERELKDMTLRDPDADTLLPLLRQLGLRAAAERLCPDLAPESAPAAEVSPDCTVCAEPPDAAFWSLADTNPVALEVSGSSLYLTAGAVVHVVPKSNLHPILSACRDKKVRIAGYDLKQAIRTHPEAGWHETGLHDALIAAYLLSHLDGKPDLARVYEAGTGKQLPEDAFPGETNRQAGLPGLEPEAPADDREEKAPAVRVRAVQELAVAQRQLLDQEGLAALFDDIEMKVLPVLADMERSGVYVDRDVLDALSEDFRKRIEDLEKQIHELSGSEFNINSPKQLSEVLFGTLGLPSGRKNASGTYSTSADELDRLAGSHPVIPLILQFRQLSKLKSTFVDGLAGVIHPEDGRVHTTFNQAITSTGRLSSSEPNLQNIPVRAAEGREIRRAFAATPGWVLLDADYSQIELRLLAHLSQDPAMLHAFTTGQDIHTNTAARIFGVSEDQVTADMRSAAKTVNFSIVYGISGYGLARDLGIGVAEAQRYIDEYYEEYAGVKTYMDRLIADAYENGYVRTLYGRRRFLPELKVRNRNVRNFGERAAMNTPVQGTAADIMKMAMVRVSASFREAKLASRLVLQVHDELIVEAPPEETEQASTLLREGMEQVVRLDVPLVADVHKGASWFETK